MTMLSSDGRPPELSGTEVSSLVCKYFKFTAVNKDSVKALPGYDDRNYFFKGITSSGKLEPFVLKVFNNIHNSISEIEGHHQIIRALHASGIISQVPQINKAGVDVILLTTSELKSVEGSSPNQAVTSHNDDAHDPTVQEKCLGLIRDLPRSRSYAVSILSFITGELFDEIDKKYLAPSVLQDIGMKLAMMDIELTKIPNEAVEARKNISWNLFYFMEMRKKIQYVSDPVKVERATLILDMFEKHVTPYLPTFGQSIIQGDMNGLNLVMEKRATDDMYQYLSFIDFSDAHKTCTVFELALCLTYFMAENLTPLSSANCVEFVRPVIDGYVRVLSLTKEELGSLYYLVLARCIQSAVNGEISFTAEPWNSYLLLTPHKLWVLIELLFEMTKDQVDRIWFS